jgi:chromosome segregation ATPase
VYGRFLSGLISQAEGTVRTRWGMATGASHAERGPSSHGAGSDAGEGPGDGDAGLMASLATAKVALAEMEGALTAARRDCARLREQLGAARAGTASLAEERDKAWEEVGSLMVQLHVLQNKNAELLEAVPLGASAGDGAGDLSDGTPRAQAK